MLIHDVKITLKRFFKCSTMIYKSKEQKIKVTCPSTSPEPQFPSVDNDKVNLVWKAQTTSKSLFAGKNNNNLASLALSKT